VAEEHTVWIIGAESFVVVQNAASERITGASCGRGQLSVRSNFGWPGLIMFRNCRNLIRTLPAMTYDKGHPEDIDPDCEEHAVKALMYGLMRRKIACRVMRVRYAA
jgi:hypothetical protein